MAWAIGKSIIQKVFNLIAMVDPDSNSTWCGKRSRLSSWPRTNPSFTATLKLRILLASDYTAKLSDFGLAKEDQKGDETHGQRRRRRWLAGGLSHHPKCRPAYDGSGEDVGTYTGVGRFGSGSLCNAPKERRRKEKGVEKERKRELRMFVGVGVGVVAPARRRR
ncbi:unnamed protein product [Lactuca virosa]|uniref:Protein kinase domain-containing protein n=1 Tax=Lactuca virosa TaxID=75947 RepID=A0AAU9M802_9ASTR|nr:unnamed protein product [Lactuca virosa]